LALAAILTLANAFKAVVVDDTAYLFFARHLAKDPSHPYDFKLFWYYEPQPANEILMPPVLPYWLAAGIALFGEKLFLLKLWLFPIAWTLTVSLASLLRKFAKGNHDLALIVLVLSPAILPQFNFMLDIPAVAFGLAAVALFVRSCDRKHWLGMIAAGLLAGLAMQTKYTQLVVPVVFAAYGISQRKWLAPLIAIAAAVALFVGWEAFVQARCGQSHFMRHFSETAGVGQGGRSGGLLLRIIERLDAAPPLISQLGGVAVGFGLWGLCAAGLPKWATAILSVAIVAPLLLIITWSYSNFEDPAWFFWIIGIGTLLGSSSILMALLWKSRRKRMLPWHWNRDTAFLTLWLLIEMGGALGLSPFPAARRVIGVALVVGLIAARAISRFDKVGRRTPRWLAVIAIAWGIALTAIDTWDADAEREAVVKARGMIPEKPGGTIWTTGHWGFQYYADVNGMTQLVPHLWNPQSGDWLVFPVLPNQEGFYRPWPPMPVLPKGLDVKLIGEVVIDDQLSAQTVPNLYGGSYVVRGRDYPRLKLAVYRFGNVP
jgi:hypothetical protein